MLKKTHLNQQNWENMVQSKLLDLDFKLIKNITELQHQFKAVTCCID